MENKKIIFISHDARREWREELIERMVVSAPGDDAQQQQPVNVGLSRTRSS
jgi:hypothetical protein